jgi:hypothetical protein
MLKRNIAIKITVLLWCIHLSTTIFSQAKMRPVGELINTKEPAWYLVKQWIDSAKNKVAILTVDSVQAKDALYKTQVTTRSPMGAIVYNTGGLLIDDGWIRILGSGNTKLKRTLPQWNQGKTFKKLGEAPSSLLIADDIMGGFFFLNGGALGKDLGKVYYFSPDNLKYEPLDLSYTDFLIFCFNTDLDDFYKGYRWKNWQTEVSKLSGDEAFSFSPSLWSKQGKDFDKVTRKVISIDELYTFNMSMRKQLGITE